MVCGLKIWLLQNSPLNSVLGQYVLQNGQVAASQIIFMLKDYLSKTGRGWTLLERRQEDLFEQAQRPLGDPRHVLHILGGGLRTSVTEAISEGIVVISPRLSEGRGRCGCGLDSELRHRKC